MVKLQPALIEQPAGNIENEWFGLIDCTNQFGGAIWLFV